MSLNVPYILDVTELVSIPVVVSGSGGGGTVVTGSLNTVLNGVGSPPPSTGSNGDFYIDLTNTGAIYGPKASGSWPSGVSLYGPGNYNPGTQSLIYPIAKTGILNGSLVVTNLSLKIALLTLTNYTQSSGDQYYSVITGSDIVATSSTLVGVGANNGALIANDVVFPALTGSLAKGYVLFGDTGNINTSPLIAYYMIPPPYFMPDGTNVTLQFDKGPNRLFQL